MTLVPHIVLSTERSGLFAEIPVNPDLSPYLVSSTQGWLWLGTSHKGVIRSAVRKGPVPEDLSLTLAREVYSESLRSQWGNTYPVGAKGMKDAIEYLQYYEVGEIEVLAPTLLDRGDRLHVTGVVSPWVPERCAVLVPADRSCLGLVGGFKDDYCVVLHNPSRGMSFLGAW